MNALLKLSGAIDRINEFVGKWVAWLILAAVVVSATNAVIRKAFNASSNAFLEIQWYFFAAVFLLCAGYTLLRNEHVKIDVILHMYSKRKQIWVDIIGIIFFLFPFVVAVVVLSWPLFVDAFKTGEMSQNAGGLVRWPVFMLVPIGFTLLGIQGVSELIKRFAFLKGMIEDPTRKKQQKTAEQELAEAILAQTQGAQK
ncbi:MAG: TRAP transporter small permease subunit [Betaproteobacteria bacterium]|nr:TRAP transporter small permease subunit [Betaproteobacteria bacterium]